MSGAKLGKVYFIGAGPGDPGLMTVRGRELIACADKVVYDSLVNESILHWVRSDGELIFAGKRPGLHSLTQEDINRLLVELALAGHHVCRLKGGDPTVFGRIGEEMDALIAAGISYEIVPGVTAGIAGPAYAGIPVTQRDVSSSVTFITGHDAVDAEGLSKLHLQGSLVFYMGVSQLDGIVEQLIAAGRSADTPVAVIEWATRPHQRTVEGTLSSIVERARADQIGAPSVIVVGEVAALRERYAWFESKPLFGKRVCITRARQHADSLITLLQAYGADVFEFPTVAVETLDVTSELEDVGSYDWILFSSINAVDGFFEQLQALGKDVRALHGIRLYAISQKTAEALAWRGLTVDGVPERYDPESILPQLEAIGGSLRGQRLLLPRADVGRSALPGALEAAGAVVTELQAYQLVIPERAEARADQLVAYGPDYVVFNSASAVRNFQALMGERLAKLGDDIVFASIGPIASKAAGQCGIEVTLEPRSHRVPELVEEIIEHARRTS